MKRYRIVFLLLVLIMTGCSYAPLTATDAAQPVSASAGGMFTIVLPANPSTGYHWEIVGELHGVELISRGYKAGEDAMPGSGGLEVWTFKAGPAGRAEIAMGNYPPGSDAAEESITFSVVIK